MGTMDVAFFYNGISIGTATSQELPKYVPSTGTGADFNSPGFQSGDIIYDTTALWSRAKSDAEIAADACSVGFHNITCP